MIDFGKFVDMLDPRSTVDDTHKVKPLLDHRYAQIGHRGKGGKDRKHLEYLVDWEGYSKREVSWEPLHNLDGCK